MRGEYFPFKEETNIFVELPPRARRIHAFIVAGEGEGGTTSACAENTTVGDGSVWLWRNYLRVRGEYYGKPYKDDEGRELPPRARRILKSF